MSLHLKQFVQEQGKTHLVFDFDATIALINIDWTNWHKGIAAIYREFDPKHTFRPKSEHNLINQYTEQFGAEIRNKLHRFNEEYEQKYANGYTPNPDLVDFIQQAKPTLSLYVYTSNARKTVAPMLASLQIADKIRQVVTRDDVDFIKPHPQGFVKIYDTSVPKKQYLMIGDSHADRGVAENAGIDFYPIDYFRK